GSLARGNAVMFKFLARLLGEKDSAGTRSPHPPTPGAAASRPATDNVRRVEESFEQLVASVRDYAVFMLDPTGHVLTWNAGAERIKGYRPEEIIGKHFSIFYPSSAVESGWPDFELKEAEAIGRFEDEGWRLRKDGTRFWANVVITTLRDAA